MHTMHTTKTAFAQKLGISRSSLYYHPKKPPKDFALKKEIETVMAENTAYGYRRVALALGMDDKKISRVMRTFGLRPKVHRARRPFKPDDIGQKELKKENSAIRLCPIVPNVLWAGDFTYLWFWGRFWYVATVIDVYTREIIGWHIGNHHTTALIIAAFTDAVKRTGKTPCWFHSDQGSEYVSGEYETLLSAHGVTPSCSRKSSPWQNGFQESFYSNFKLELGDVHRFDGIGELTEAIHQQIAYYNGKRIHTTIKMPPMIFRQLQEQKTAVVTAII